MINQQQKHYWLFPTRSCNLRCEYCYQTVKRDPNDSANYMDMATARNIAEFIERDEPHREKRIQFFGGEPLLAWDVIEFFVKRFFGKVRLSITTNGMLLNKERLEYLKNHNFELAVSIDGPPGVTRKTRPGSEVVDIDLINEFYPQAQIIMTFSPANIEDAYRSTLYFLDKGFLSIAHNIMTEKPWPKEAVTAHDKVFEELTDCYIKRFSSGQDMPGFMFIGFAKKAVNGSTFKGLRNMCGSNPNLLAIDINGDIYPCQDMVTCDHEKRYRIGNVNGGYIPPEPIPLTEMKFPDREKCRLCWFYHQCVGGCGPKNLITCGDRYKASGNCCELFAKQTMEGLRAVLNTTGLLLNREKKYQSQNCKLR